jgi:hypothetical protein
LLLGQIALEESGEYEATFEQHNIRCAFIPAESTLARRLTDDGWRTAFSDATWAVLIAPYGATGAEAAMISVK